MLLLWPSTVITVIIQHLFDMSLMTKHLVGCEGWKAAPLPHRNTDIGPGLGQIEPAVLGWPWPCSSQRCLGGNPWTFFPCWFAIQCVCVMPGLSFCCGTARPWAGTSHTVALVAARVFLQQCRNAKWMKEIAKTPPIPVMRCNAIASYETLPFFLFFYFFFHLTEAVV